MSYPRVSVILPNYNHAPLVGQAIESLGSQTSTAQELIVIDDASTDDSLDRINDAVATMYNVRVLRNAGN